MGRAWNDMAVRGALSYHEMGTPGAEDVDQWR